MKPSYNLVFRLTLVLFVGASLQLTEGISDTTRRLEQLIEQAEKESKILANEINQWLIQESGSPVTEDEQEHYRSRRSDDEDDEDVQTDTNLLPNIGRLIVRRDAGKHEDNHKKKKDSPEIKTKDKKVAKESHLSKKHGLQADKHDVNKATTSKKVQDKKKTLKAKRVSKQQDKKPKHKANSEELSKENLVKALIGGDARAKDHKEQTGVPEKAYRALVEFMARSEQPIIETGTKKSDIAKPQVAGGKDHLRSSKAKQGVRRKLTKKHKRVLAILSKMPQSVLRKYFHLEGLDKYWKVMDNIRRKQATKEIAKKKLKTHKDQKIVKELKDLAPKKAKTSTHLEKMRLLQKEAKSHQKNSKQNVSSHKVVKDKEAQKMVKNETTTKKTGKVKTAGKVVQDKTTEKSQKPTALHSPSSQKSAKNDAKQTQIEPAHLKKDQSHKTAMEQHAKAVVPPKKDTPKNLSKGVKSKDFNKVEGKIEKNDAGKSAETSKVAPHIKETTSPKKAIEKPKSHAKDLSKKEAEKKVSLKPAAAKQTAPTKDAKEKALYLKDKPAQDLKVVKANATQLKSPASVQALKTAAKLQAAHNKDLHTHEIKVTKDKPQVHVQTESLQHQLKATAPNVAKKVINQSSSAVANDKPKEIPKALVVTEHHEVRAAHAPQKPEVKQVKDSQVKQLRPGASKIDILKEKIQKTNTLKFKVAQALIAHCETQDRLRQVFDEVNSSLKKAASLAKAIGAKFGIKPSDVEKMTSEHTEGAVEQFLNKLF